MNPQILITTALILIGNLSFAQKAGPISSGTDPVPFSPNELSRLKISAVMDQITEPDSDIVEIVALDYINFHVKIYEGFCTFYKAYEIRVDDMTKKNPFKAVYIKDYQNPICE